MLVFSAMQNRSPAFRLKQYHTVAKRHPKPGGAGTLTTPRKDDPC